MVLNITKTLSFSFSLLGFVLYEKLVKGRIHLFVASQREPLPRPLLKRRQIQGSCRLAGHCKSKINVSVFHKYKD